MIEILMVMAQEICAHSHDADSCTGHFMHCVESRFETLENLESDIDFCRGNIPRGFFNEDNAGSQESMLQGQEGPLFDWTP